MKKQIALPVSEASQAAEARRMAVNMAVNLGFDEAGAGKVAIVAAEAARNLVKYASGGELLLRSLESGGINGLEIMALDRGPGMENVSRCLDDGYSTSGSPSQGLGAISRIADMFDIHSAVGRGTALVAHIWAKAQPEGQQRPACNAEYGAVCLPRPGETISGDGWADACGPGWTLVLLADGLGHGPLAAEASMAAIKIFRENTRLDPARIVERIHAALRSTRGAALAVARVDLARRQVIYCGIGNVSGIIVSREGSTGMASFNGTAGGEVSKIIEVNYPWPEDAILVMHSDGLSSHWKLNRYPGLKRKHPALIAGVLYRDYSRENDDVTVLVVKGVR
ncbi:MAG: ATP-binding SpoIIE family protein phosphatase [bacterium]